MVQRQLIIGFFFVLSTMLSCRSATYDASPYQALDVHFEEVEEVEISQKITEKLKKETKEEKALEKKEVDLDLVRAQKILETMTLEEKIGQLLFLGFGGTQMDEQIASFFKNYKAGAVAFFGRNVKHLGQTMALIRDVRKYDPAGIPMFISVDQEGGKVTRIKRYIDILPSQMALGATTDTNLAFRAGEAIGAQLSVMGFNMNLAPVLDVNSNPKNPVIGTRSFSSNAQLVADMGYAYIEGMQKSGISAVAKHFPGHGDTQSDSHFALPVLQHDRQRLDSLELIPFQKVTKEQTVDAIMTAHIALPKITGDGETPATLSPQILTDILRKDLAYEGIVMTDGLEMAGIVDRYGSGEAAVRAVLAGADMVMVLWFKEKKAEVRSALRKAIKSGRISMQRLDESVLRILKTKIRRGLFEKQLLDLKSASLKIKANRKEISLEIAQKAVTLVINKNQLLPVMKAGKLKTNAKRILLVSAQRSLTKILKKKIPSLQTIRLAAHPSLHQIKKIMQQIKSKLNNIDLIIFALKEGRSLLLPAKVQQLLRKTRVGNSVKIAAISFASPYMLYQFPKVDAFMCTFGFRYESDYAAAKAILGDLNPKGKLPVELSKEYPFGHSLSYSQ